MLLRKNRKPAKLTGKKTFATMAASVLAFGTCAQTAQRTTRVVVDGKEVTDQQNQSGERRYREVKWKNDNGSGSISAENVELTADSKDVKSIGKKGHLVIDETRDGVRRRLRIEPATDGKLKRTYSVNGVAQELDEEGQAWLAGILQDVFWRR